MRSLVSISVCSLALALSMAASGNAETRTLQNGVRITPFPAEYGDYYSYYNCREAVISPDAPDANFGREIETGLVGGTNQKLLIVFRELNRAIPPGMEITSAQLRLHAVPGQWTSGNQVRIHRLLKPWRQGSFTGEGPQQWACSWQHRFYSERPGETLSWDVPGAAGDGTDRIATPSATTTTGSGSVLTISGLGADVQAFYEDHHDNYGWVIEYVDPQAASGVNLVYSSEAIDIGLRPELVITYTPDVDPPSRDVDLDVTYISRTPEYYRYEPVYDGAIFHDSNVGIMKNPGYATTQKWPNNGDVVTFTAHVINKGLSAGSGAFSYRWMINEEVVATGVDSVGLMPGEEGQYDYDWTWDANDYLNDADLHRKSTDHRDRIVTFEVDYLDEVDEHAENNNRLDDFLEAPGMGFYVEQSMYDYFHEQMNATGSYSFEDWIQWVVRVWNETYFEMSRFEGFAEDGSFERVRIQKIQIVPDGVLCAGGNHNVNCATNFRIDGEWGFRPDESYVDRWSKMIEWALLHECSHQLGLIDLYTMNMETGTPSNPSKMQVKDGGDHFLTRGYYPPYGALMGGGDSRYNEQYEAQGLYAGWDVGAMNANCGYRRGFYGEQLYNLPDTVKLRALDTTGAPIPYAEVKIWQSNGGVTREVRDWQNPDSVVYDWQPIFQGFADENGVVTLPNVDTLEPGPVTTYTGHTLTANPWGRINVVGSNGSLFIKVVGHGQTDYEFVRIPQINRAYWGGYTDEYTHDLGMWITPAILGETNVAVGGTASTNFNGVASYAVDGNLNTDWNSGNTPAGTWIQVDLRDTYNVGQVVLLKNGWPQDFFKEFRIELSQTGAFSGEQMLFAREPINWHYASGLRRDIDPDDEDLLWVKYAGMPTEARYVRITSEAGHWSRLTELQVFEAVGTSPPLAFGAEYETPMNAPVTIPLSAVSIVGAPLDVIVNELPQHGTLVDIGHGEITVVPHTVANSDHEVQYVPDAGYNGSDTFAFYASDGQDSELATIQIEVGGPRVFFAFNMDEDPGWTAEGDWEWGVPLGGSGSHGQPDPTSGYTGDNVYGYNLSGGYSPLQPERRLTTSAFNCTGLQNVTLRFQRWLGVESNSYDRARLQISTNGTSWDNVWENPSGLTDDGEWVLVEYDLSAWADGAPAVQLRWTMGPTDDSWQYCGWNIDDVEIWALGDDADCNGNGVPDPQDIADGTSEDCNENNVPDECDIASGTSLDTNGNDVPDECEIDCNSNGRPDFLDLLDGTSDDCNGNNVPDECDIADGTSDDANGNGVPDECDPDCNGNGVPDDLDIDDGTSDDCNGNGVPDECDIASGTSSDDNGNGIPDECDNQPPIVDAGEDIQVSLPDAGVLSGVAQDDGRPDPPGMLTYHWELVDGPSGVVIDTPAGLTTSVTFDTPGTYLFELEVYDGEFAVADTVIARVYGDATRVTDGLVVLYDFAETSGDVVHDVSGYGDPLDLIIRGPDVVNWTGEGLLIEAETIVDSGTAATKIYDACTATNEITIEAWVDPMNTFQSGPARIVTYSWHSYSRNFTMGQGTGTSGSGDVYDVRLRTTDTSNNGIPSTTTPDGSVSGMLQHVVYTRAVDGSVILYIDDVPAIATTIAGDFSNWDANQIFGLANEMTYGRAWLGEFRLVALYARALSPEEISQNFAAGPDPDLIVLTPGDLNCDGSVDFADINPFVAALSGESAYAAQYPDCQWLNGDANGDGTVDFDDINAFVALLSQ